MSDWEYCTRSLRDVSRTFSQPIEMLEEKARIAVTCGYLLCRIADTVEDHPTLPHAQRDRLYAEFLAVVERGEPPEVFERSFAEIIPEDTPETLLCRSLGRVIRVFRTLPPSYQAACAPWVAEMTRGMAIYSHRVTGSDGLTAVLTLDDLERYCFFVAGTVGHLLTGVFELELMDLPPERRAVLHRTAESFGLGLQLVNILKDVTDDWARGVSYVPRAAAEAVGLPLSDLLSPERRSQAHAAVAPMFDRAHRHLDEAFAYCLAIPPTARAIRLFCLLPLWMAVRTLSHARGNDAQFTPGAPVKITREEVATLISDCVARCQDDDALRAGYHRLAAAA